MHAARPSAAPTGFHPMLARLVTAVVLAPVAMMSTQLEALEPNQFMDCGGAPLCGVLTLETGLGPGAYRHDFVSVHGLWPETGRYGSSRCITPSSSSADPGPSTSATTIRAARECRP